MRYARWTLVALGGSVMVYGVVGAISDPDVRPLGHLLFLAGVLLAHDVVLLPAAIGVGVLIGRCLPTGARVPARAAAFITATLLVVAVPLALGLGRRPDTPSALPLDYGRGLAITALVVWATALAATLAATRRHGSHRR